jgi:SAM-dependent methyltransferase
MMALLGGKRDVSASAAEIDVNTLLEDYKWPDEFPFRAQDFERFDEGRDSAFYSEPRFVTHIDDGAIKALTKFYDANLPKSGQKDVAILDMCSSWISHLPKDYSAGQIVGLGMNEEELKANEALTSYNVQDLNENPKMPYDDCSFDCVINAVSVDYMTKPLQLFQEIQRVLKPGGTAIMSFSNRCFPTKAIAIWTQTGDPDHVLIVGSYFHYAGGFEKPKALDISPAKKPFFGGGDPMYVVYGRKPLA